MTMEFQTLVIKLRSDQIEWLERVGRRLQRTAAQLASLCVEEALRRPDDAREDIKRPISPGQCDRWVGHWLDLQLELDPPIRTYLSSLAKDVSLSDELLAAKLIALMLARQPAVLVAQMLRSGTLPAGPNPFRPEPN